MALPMSRPVALASGVYHLNVRVPKDLAAKVRGSRVILPIDGRQVAAKVGDKVFVSLRTKDAAVAKTRFAEAFAALARQWEAARQGPKPLDHRSIVALAGDAYRSFATDREALFGPGAFEAEEAAHAQEVADYMYGDGDDGGAILPLAEADFLATMSMPCGPQLITWREGRDVSNAYFTMTLARAQEDLFGRQADEVCARHGLELDEASRSALLHQIGLAVVLGTSRLVKTSEGDFSPDPHLARYPPLSLPKAASAPPRRGAKVTLGILFDRWKTYHADKRAPSTTRRYGPSIRSLDVHLGGKDVREVEADDVWAWAERRRDVDGIAARTVNGNDLVAASSVFDFATTRDSDDKASGERKRPLRADNPVRGVKLDLPRLIGKKGKVFKMEDVATILRLARAVEINPKHPQASASRRWAPWICAYSGARIQEVCWLRREDVRREDGIWVMEFPVTKDGFARTVPIHDALLDEGLADFRNACAEGFLFIGDGPRKADAKMTPQELRAGDIASWISDNVDLDPRLSPNHSWRHTFITNADEIMSKRMANRLAGHNKKKDASDGYYDPPLEKMKEALDRYPRYAI